MASDADVPKRESTPTASLSSIPQKRALDEVHVPAVSSPLNPDSHTPDDASQSNRSKPARVKKESFKKRDARAGDSVPPTPDSKAARERKEAANLGPLRYKLAPPKPSDFEAPRGPVLTAHNEIVGSDGKTVEFYETSDHVANKKNFRYTHCIADPLFPTTVYYRQTEPEPYGPRMSHEDAAAHVYFDSTALQVTTDKGFRLTRANVAVREGRWFWECKITQGIKPAAEGQDKLQLGKHVRVGWARRESSLDAPVGFDCYSYGIRDVAGEKVYMSRPKEFFPAGEGIREGDVIGLEIQLPSERLHRKIMEGNFHPLADAADDDTTPTAAAANIVRDRVPIRFKAHTYFERIEYHTTRELEDLMNPSMSASSTASTDPPHPNHASPALRTLPNSYMKIYKNGKLMGTAFEDLLGFLPPASKPMPQVGAREGMDDGMLGYYPAISIFRGGAAEANFGPNFAYPPPDYDPSSTSQPSCKRLRGIYERYQEQIAEDIVYDIIDEVDFWMQDAGDETGSSQKNTPQSLAPAREEIKELMEDD